MKTDDILKAISDEIELRRLEIERETGLVRVDVIVKLHAQSGQPHTVDFRKESSRSLVRRRMA